MEKPNVQSQLDSSETRAKRLERGLKFTICGWLLTLTFMLFSSSSWKMQLESTQKPRTQSDTLRVRELVVVDEKGKERIVIAAPLPDPMVNGKIAHRRDVVSAGIQFKDPNGNERGGIAALEDGSFLFGIDDELGRERAHLYYIPGRGSGVYLQGEKETETVSLLLPSAGGSPKLEMTDQAGRKTVVTSTQK